MTFIEIYGLAYECPYKRRNESCPLSVLESFSFKERVKWIDNQDESKIKSIMKQHMICSSK